MSNRQNLRLHSLNEVNAEQGAGIDPRVEGQVKNQYPGITHMIGTGRGRVQVRAFGLRWRCCLLSAVCCLLHPLLSGGLGLDRLDRLDNVEYSYLYSQKENEVRRSARFV